MHTEPPRQIRTLEGVYSLEICADSSGLRADFEDGEGIEAKNLEDLIKRVALHIARAEK